MEKLRNILSSASGKKEKKVGPPVPPRPPKTTVQKALEKTRNLSLNFHPPPAPSTASVPIAKGRTVIYTSIDNNNKCFDTKLHESSTTPTGLKAIETTQNGNAARATTNKESTATAAPVIHYKSPVPRPRLKTPPSVPSTLLSTLPNSRIHQGSTSSPPADYGIRRARNSTRDDELKEKLMNEIFSGRLVETSNVHLRFNGSNLKRSSSCDVLNDRNSIMEMSPPTPHNRQPQEKSKDRKVVFHEILISELSEMRRENHRLSAAKSCSDLSPSGGQKQVFTIVDIGRSDNNTCPISLEDSGVEDEEKLDDCSSSGVGDSWDSCKEMQNR